MEKSLKLSHWQWKSSNNVFPRRYGTVLLHHINKIGLPSVYIIFQGGVGGGRGAFFLVVTAWSQTSNCLRLTCKRGESSGGALLCVFAPIDLSFLCFGPPSQIISIWISSGGGKTPLQDALPTSTFGFFFHLWLRSILLLPFYFGTSHDHKTFIFLASLPPLTPLQWKFLSAKKLLQNFFFPLISPY